MTSALPFLDVLKQLISFDSTSNKSNLSVIKWIQEYVQAEGAITDLVYNPTHEKANLFVTFPAADGETKKGGIIFSGHTDVVPVKDQVWDTDPFALVIKDGKALGRGVCDMKGFLALVLAESKNLGQRQLKVPVHFAFSFDEEVGCLGVPFLIDYLREQNITPKYCIVGEPTEMSIVNGHKGQLFYKVTVKGLESHSSLIDNGVNAIDYAVKLISFIHEIAERERASGVKSERFDPSFNTFHVGVIQGGTVNNIIPNHCEFQFEVRYLPGHYPQQQIQEIKDFAAKILLPKMQERFPQAGIEFVKSVDYPGLDVPENCDLIDICKQLTGANHVTSVAFGAEAGHFQHANIETIICGPGSIEQAHKANEFILLDQLERGSIFVRQLIDHFTAR